MAKSGMHFHKLRLAALALTVSVALTGCDSADSSEKDVSQIEDIQWNLAKIGDQSVPTDDPHVRANLTFHSKDHRVSGSGGCNQFQGGYTVDGESLSFGQIASTLKACAEGMDLEQVYLSSFEDVATWRIDKGHLEFLDSDGRLLMRFESVAD